MRNRIGALLIAAVLAFVPAASAHGVGAALSLGPPHGAFTLQQAHQVAIRFERRSEPHARVHSCHWLDRHTAGCNVTSILTILDGTRPALFAWTDQITRSGPCSLTGTIRKAGSLTIITGRRPRRNCFTGPLVALAGSPVTNNPVIRVGLTYTL